MTASVLKQDPKTKRFKRTLIYFDTVTQYAKFPGNPVYQATKTTLKQQINGQKSLKYERKRLTLFWFSFYSLFGAWKIKN